MPFFNDTFTDAEGADLASAHTSDSGHSWSYAPAAVYAGSSKCRGNALSGDGVNVTRAKANATPATADYDVVADFLFRSASGAAATELAGILTRLDTTNDNHYELVYYRGQPGYLLRKRVATVITLLASTTESPADGTTHSIKLSTVGTSIVGTKGGAALVSVTDASVTAKGNPGTITRISNSSSTGVQLDNYVATDASGGGHTVTVGQISETDIAQPLARLKIGSLNQATETDSVFLIVGRKLKAVGQVSETDAALAARALKTRVFSQVIEVSVAQPLLGRKFRLVNQATELDTARAISHGGAVVVTGPNRRVVYLRFGVY